MAHVCVVDDDPEIRALLRSALEFEGHAVVEADDGLSALEVLRADPRPRVVLLDYHLPHLDGAGVLEAVVAEPALVGRHRFILMTGSPQTLPLALGTLLMGLGVPLVTKPFGLAALLDLVARLARETEPAAPEPAAPWPRFC